MGDLSFGDLLFGDFIFVDLLFADCFERGVEHGAEFASLTALPSYCDFEGEFEEGGSFV